MYAAAADLVDRFTIEEVSALAPSEMPNEYNLVVINSAMEDADAEINSYLAVRYAVPVEGSKQLKAVACDIARYRMYDNDAPEQVETRYQQRVTWLKDVAAGRATLGIAESITSQTLAVTTTKNRESRTFTRDSLANF